MSNYTCKDCKRPIPNGSAVIRSESFKRVTLHKYCAELRGIARVSGVAVGETLNA